MITQTRGSAVLQTQKTFLVKERVGVLKLTDTFDIFDPQTGGQIALAIEQISTVAKPARIFINKRFLPTTLVVRHQNGVGDVWMSLRRGV